MKKTTVIPLFFFLNLAMLAAAAVLPGHGSVRSRMLLDFVVPDSGLVDLAAATLITEYDERCSVYGDTLLCLCALGSNEWLLAREGTLWRAGWNDRTTQRRLSHVMPYLTDRASVAENSDTLTVTYLDFPSESREVTLVTGAGGGCGFVTTAGDTVLCPICVREDWIETLGDGTQLRRTLRRWHQPGQALPLVWSETVSFGSQDWSVTSVPSPGSERQRIRKRDNNDKSPERIVPSGSQVNIYDIQGRLMLSGAEVSATSSLPQGVYIMETVRDGVSEVTKIWVR